MGRITEGNLSVHNNQARKTGGLAILLSAALAALPGCVEKNQQPRQHFTMQTWRDEQPVIDITHPASTQPSAIAEPKMIEEGEKATLFYPPRFARPETLREAIEGLITPEGSAQASASLNTLIVADRKDIVRSIMGVLKEIDRPGQQLLVEARVVEITLDSDLETELSHILTVTGSPGS